MSFKCLYVKGFCSLSGAAENCGTFTKVEPIEKCLAYLGFPSKIVGSSSCSTNPGL